MASTNIVLGAIFIASFYLSASLAFPPGHHEGAYPVGNGPISGLSPDYYKFTCPQADEIVVSILKKAIAKEPRIAASLLRLLFHDCFVQSGGPYWELPLGRRDSKTANMKLANKNLPPPNATLHRLIKFFQRQGLDKVDLVALSGSHTIGKARCVSFKQRLYNQHRDNRPDITLEKSFYHTSASGCPRTGGDNNIRSLDFVSPSKFDNSYYKLILEGKGLLNSDEVLWTGKDPEIAGLVKSYAENEPLFFEHYVNSVIKMGNINPLMGHNGEIRKNCRRVNQEV
ncbi:Peroxidase 15 [Panicum miliaceum]|uniref:Peroxidase n=1 Tax=Panicum miliaceum TaxID=4540 RepID=A0A3L6QWW5_PANMI|nr:Peroxidase 15 [Panicum miliaceum]